MQMSDPIDTGKYTHIQPEDCLHGGLLISK